MLSQLGFPLRKDTSRKIIHIDMDAFFASIEERDQPELKNFPLVIARHPKDTGGRGVVTTANYKAREFGIHSAMSAQKAYELCPKAIFKAGNLTYYKEVSAQVRAIFDRYTDVVEQASIDEAYLDVTENKINAKSAIKIAKLIQRDIYQELHLTCSAGVSYNKFLAKLGSDFQKPRGMTVILPEKAEAFLQALPIEKFHGIGKKTVPKMHELGVFTGKDLAALSEWQLINEFGKMGYSLYRKVRGIHDDPVNPARIRKSMGREHTYGKLLFTEDEVVTELRQLAKKVAESMLKYQKQGQIVVLKVRDGDYNTITKRKTLKDYLQKEEDIYFYAKELFDETIDPVIGIRLLGITITGLEELTYENLPLPLFKK
ncbi:DNA polymerase IV [Enterococcus timonensis]|uniref:DNA polymerase IV n=1 Tax=Enterococcus timonensis TaxID=1852364 RepID=UPI0009F5B07A|nr:DNA polymerase IV [Enterococcus timonensis]